MYLKQAPSVLFDSSSRVGSPTSVHSPVFPRSAEHAKDILNKCHVASDGKSADERLKRRQHRGVLLPLGTAVMFSVMTERWHLGTWLGKRFHTEEHIVAGKGDGLVIRSGAVKAMLEEDDVEIIWTRSRSLHGPTLECGGRSTSNILSRDEPPFVPVERPMPRNMKLSRNECSHPGLAHSQDCRTRIEAASRTDPVYRDCAAECQRKWNELIIQGELHWNQVLCLSHQLKRRKVKINQVFGIPSEPVGSQNRSCQVKSLSRVQMRR